MNCEFIGNIVKDCLAKLEREEFRGYDPSDLLSSEYNFIRNLMAPARRILNLINFYSPINFRKPLRITKQENVTAMILLGNTYLNLFRLDGDESYREKINYIVEWLLEKSLKTDNSIGWSRTIPYQSRMKYTHDERSTLTFINAQAGLLFLNLYEVFGDSCYLKTQGKIANQLLYHTDRITVGEGVCLSYTDNGRDEIPNASILAGEFLNRVSGLIEDEDCYDLSIKILRYVLSVQNRDGSWFYRYINGRKKKKQIDFHQTYMLDSIINYAMIEDQALLEETRRKFKKGCRFYFDRMFDRKIRPYWRYPVFYPIDIHNVSHAVLFLSKNRDYLREYHGRLEPLIKLLINDFYDHEKKYFYYQKYFYYTIKHDYFRWNTAWSLMALSYYLIRECD